MKKFRSIFTSLLLVAVCVSVTTAHSALDVGYVALQAQVLSQNHELMSVLQPSSAQVVTRNSQNTTMQFRIDNPEANEAVLNFQSGDYSFDIFVKGQLDSFFEADVLLGYAGVYDGFISSEAASAITGEAYEVRTRVTVDITIAANNDMMAIVTIGTYGSNITPTILAYGNYTDAVRILSKEYAQMSNEEEVQTGSTNVAAIAEQKSASVKKQATDYFKINGNKVGLMTVFHGNDAMIGGGTPVFCKLNSDSDQFLDAISDINGYDPLDIVGVKVDSADIGIKSVLSSTFAIVSYRPGESEKNINLDIEINELYTVTIVLPISSVSVSDSFSGAEWSFYRAAGWDASDTDGQSNDDTGIATQVTYSAIADLDKYTSGKFNVTGSMRYRYNYYSGDDFIVMHAWTNQISRTTSVSFFE